MFFGYFWKKKHMNNLLCIFKIILYIYYLKIYLFEFIFNKIFDNSLFFIQVFGCKNKKI